MYGPPAGPAPPGVTRNAPLPGFSRRLAAQGRAITSPYPRRGRRLLACQPMHDRHHPRSFAPSFLSHHAPIWLSVLTALAACGGGGSASPAATAVSPAASAPSGATSTCGLANFQATSLALVNQARAAGANCGTHGSFAPAAPLSWNALLTQAAEGHSQDMVAHNFFAHNSFDGRTFDQRISATGYTWSRAAENIAAGQQTIAEVMAGWMASDGHCANIMNPNLAEIGMVCVSGTASTAYSTYWTMDLATPR